MRALIVIGVVLAARAAAADPVVPADLAVFDEHGIRIGANVVFSGPVSDAALDDAQDLIWFTSKGTLEVIDLRATRPAPVVILTHVPAVGFQIDGVSHAAVDTLYTNAYLSLTVDKKPSVSAIGAVYEVVDPVAAKKLRRDIKKAKIAGGGAVWIKAQLARKAKPAPPAPRPDPPAVTAVKADGDNCQTGDCGTAFWLGGTPYQEVIVQGACGDACYRGCALYDPAKKLFAPAGTTGTWGKLTDDIKNVGCIDIVVSPANDRYYAGSTVCTIGATMTCTDLGTLRAMGWMTPLGK